MILVGQYDSPFVRRVAVTLHHYRMAFTRNALSVFTDAEAMGKINPLTRIPSLVLDSGEILIDSGAIIDHLDERAGPAQALTPPHGPERRKVVQAVAAATGAIDKAGAVVYERHFHPGPMLCADWERRCLGQLGGALAHLEGACGAPWFFSTRPTQADITIGCMIGYLGLRLAEALPAGRHPKLHELSARCEALEEFINARPSPDEVMPARS